MEDQELKEFNELRAIVQADGFMKLESKAKRDRYRELKDKYEFTEEKVMISKADLKTMLDEAVDRYKQEALKEYKESGLEEAKQMGKWIKARQIKEKNKIAKLRVYREDGAAEPGVIVNVKILKYAFNEATRKYDDPIARIKVLFATGEEERDIRLVELSAIQEYETVEIIKTVEEPQVLIQGTGNRPYTKGGYQFSNPGMFGAKEQQVGDEFDYIVTRKDVMCTVKRPNGDTIELHSSKLNN